MHYFLIAGEASGDLHAADLIEALKLIDKDSFFTFLGGDRMALAAAKEPVVHYNQMAFMGFSEVLRNIGKIGQNMKKAKLTVKLAQPDALILIDYPSFNLKVGEYASKMGIPVYYYISPKIWAWKKWRINTIKKVVRRVFSILPFEPEFYRQNGGEAIYVGNPSVSEMKKRIEAAPGRKDFLAKYRLRDRALVALMPGSRLGEIRNNLPVMIAAMDTFPQYRPFIIGAPGVADAFYATFVGRKEIPLIRPEHATEALAHCAGALVTSGTATLETAIAKVPQVVLYRANGSKVAYEIMSRILDVKFVSLPNLICNKAVVPEMLLHDCTPERVADVFAPLLRKNSPEQLMQTEGYGQMLDILGDSDAAMEAAKEIYSDLALIKK